ncbi:MAG: S41 family peptidase [Saprospiraceae bacterium]|nr:S41 family peptidase [Saprospiraceae bacterium]
MKKHYYKILGILVLVITFSAFTYQDKYFEIIKNIEIFSNVYKEVNENYVDGTNPSKLMKVGIDAMLAALDPFTNFYSEAQVEEYRLTTEGKYNGIGAKARKMGDYVVITEVYKDYPAFKAGLKIGDQVIAVNGEDAKGKQAEDLYQIMRGIPKSEVNITIRRPGTNDKQTLKLVRDEVNIPNVPYSGMIDESTGYLILTTFTESAGANVQAAVRKLKSENPGLKSIVLDLRENGGGLLGEAVQVCNTFVPAGVLIASTRGKEKQYNATYKTQAPPIDDVIPLAVLINKHSASASEIVSGSMQDLDRGVVIGQLSYGKGLVQNTKEVGYNSRVKFTTAKYYIPSGRCIQNVKYENGVRVLLSDSLRSVFKTKNGRTVYDGGGVKPDIEMEEADYPFVVQKLLEDNWIFNFCTEYGLNNPAPQDPITYTFTDFNLLLDYLRKNKFDDNSDIEKKLKVLEDQVSVDKTTSIQDDILKMRTELEQQQWLEIEKNKDIINHLVEEEIVYRHFYEPGKVQCRFKHDPLIKKAIEVLRNTQEYKKILAQK